MKLTPGLDVINILRTAFTPVDPKSVKNTVKLSIFFMLLGSTRAKAVCKILMKWTLWVDFPKLCAPSEKSLVQKIRHTISPTKCKPNL